MQKINVFFSRFNGLLYRIVCIVCVAVLTIFSSVFSICSFATDNTDPWAALGEDAVNLRDSYIDYLRSWTSGDLEGVFSNLKDLPTTWFKTLSDGTKAIAPAVIGDSSFILDSAHNAIVRKAKENGEVVDTPASEVPPELPSDFFKDIVTEVETFYSPSGDLDRISWRSDTRWNSNKNSDVINYRFGRMTLAEDFKFLNKWYNCYLLPFYFDGTDYYYGKNILYLYYGTDENGSFLKGEAPLMARVYNTDTSSVSDPVTLVDNLSYGYLDVLPYCYRENYTTGLHFNWVSSYLGFNSNEYMGSSFRGSRPVSQSSFGFGYFDYHYQTYVGSNPEINNFFYFVKSSDISYSFSWNNYDIYMSDWYPKFAGREGAGITPAENNLDYGFICSDTYFYPQIGGYTDLDTEKIPANTTVTITGDSIGDYTYTDNTTGDTTTINEYVTNNYTYPESGGSSDSGDSGDSGSGGSGSSGDVNVGGNVNVSGNVNVGGQIDINTKPIDINVNVNGGSSGSGSSGTSEGVQFDQDVSLNNYYDWMNEQTSGFSSFMQQFFGWLPADVVILICAGFACVILARFLGR